MHGFLQTMENNKRSISFSVVIPAWNAAATIVRSVQSCLDQSYPPLEVIVIDDASTDETVSLLRSFGDRVKVVTLDRNSGPSRARNAGMDLAAGDFIAFQDADDAWHRDKLSLAARALAGAPRIRFLFHRYTLEPMPEEVQSQYRGPVKYAFAKMLLRNPVATPCAILINDRSLRFDEAMRHMEDYALFLKAAARYGLYCIDLPLTRLGRPVLSAGGQSADRWAMRTGELTAWLQLARSRPVFYLLLPFLVPAGLLKHVLKSLFRR